MSWMKVEIEAEGEFARGMERRPSACKSDIPEKFSVPRLESNRPVGAVIQDISLRVTNAVNPQLLAGTEYAVPEWTL